MLTFNYGSTYFSNKVVLTLFIRMCCMVWDLIWGTSPFYKSKAEEVKRGGKSAIRPSWCYWQSITVVSTPPSFMLLIHLFVYNKIIYVYWIVNWEIDFNYKNKKWWGFILFLWFHILFSVTTLHLEKRTWCAGKLFFESQHFRDGQFSIYLQNALS